MFLLRVNSNLNFKVNIFPVIILLEKEILEKQISQSSPLSHSTSEEQRWINWSRKFWLTASSLSVKCWWPFGTILNPLLTVTLISEHCHWLIQNANSWPSCLTALQTHSACWLPFPLFPLGEGQWHLANDLSSGERPQCSEFSIFTQFCH